MRVFDQLQEIITPGGAVGVNALPVIVARLNETIRLLKRMDMTGPLVHETSTGAHIRREPRVAVDEFIGEIVTAGPNEEEDFGNAWYWVKEYGVIADPTEQNPSAVLVAVSPVNIVQALHLTEVGSGADKNGAHVLLRSPNRDEVAAEIYMRFVLVKSLSGLYYFETYPAAMFQQYLIDVTTLDENGCPCTWSWQNAYGPGIVEAGVALPQCE